MIGAQLGAYRVLCQIGEGSMGSVWLARHAMLGSHAAIKVLHAAYAGNEDLVSRFFNEARAATAIRDPGVVQVYDFGYHHDGSAYIVMELLEGEPLDRRLARVGTLDVRDALRFARQLATALAAAHARGIIHRDLKPENIFLIHDPEVAGGERAKLLDFGVAKLTGIPPMTRAYAVIGTPVYMSPEQCAGTGVDHRCDLYSLGGVLYNLLTGAPPFDGASMLELIAQHLTEPAPAPSRRNTEVPPEVDALVLRCLAKDPAERFAAAHELACAIDALLARSTQPSLPSPPVARRIHDVPTLVAGSNMSSHELPTKIVRPRPAPRDANPMSSGSPSPFSATAPASRSAPSGLAGETPTSYNTPSAFEHATPRSYGALSAIEDTNPRSYNSPSALEDTNPRSYNSPSAFGGTSPRVQGDRSMFGGSSIGPDAVPTIVGASLASYEVLSSGAGSHGEELGSREVATRFARATPPYEVPTMVVPALDPRRPRRWLAGMTALAALAGAIAFTIAVCG